MSCLCCTASEAAFVALSGSVVSSTKTGVASVVTSGAASLFALAGPASAGRGASKRGARHPAAQASITRTSHHDPIWKDYIRGMCEITSRPAITSTGHQALDARLLAGQGASFIASCRRSRAFGRGTDRRSKRARAPRRARTTSRDPTRRPSALSREEDLGVDPSGRLPIGHVQEIGNGASVPEDAAAHPVFGRDHASPGQRSPRMALRHSRRAAPKSEWSRTSCPLG
jgi:hypothetical protein